MSNRRKLRPNVTTSRTPVDHDRRVRACLKAGLVHDVFETMTMLQVAVGVAQQVSAEGKNPADYLDFDRVQRMAAPVAARMEASGFSEASNRAWEARNGTFDTGEEFSIVPRSKRRRDTNSLPTVAAKKKDTPRGERSARDQTTKNGT